MGGLRTRLNQECNKAKVAQIHPEAHEVPGAQRVVAERRQVEALVAAAGSGNAAEVERLLKQDPVLVNFRTSRDQTALTAAAQEGCLSVVSILHDRGAYLDHVDSVGKTALYWAAQRGHDCMVRLLLQCGADPSIRECEGWTPLMGATMRGHVHVVRTLLHTAGQCGNQVLPDGRSVLWLAVFYSNVEVAKCLLLEGRADHTQAETKNGMTPLRMARLLGKQPCIDLLEWFEKELERPYVLHKAWAIHDQQVTCGHSYHPRRPHRGPAYLEAREAAGLPLPCVHLTHAAPTSPHPEALPMQRRTKKANSNVLDNDNNHATGAALDGTPAWARRQQQVAEVPEHACSADDDNRCLACRSSNVVNADGMCVKKRKLVPLASHVRAQESDMECMERPEDWVPQEREEGHDEVFAVVDFVLNELPRELYFELLEGLRLR